ncbi:MAG: hypothetical protein AAGJ50_03385 [Pseudomonadota bacterium]
MMFKRPPLRPACRIVNAVGMLGLIFIGACSPAGETADPSRTETEIVEQGDKTARDLVIPAVWTTSALGGDIHDIAFAGGSNPIMAAVLGDGLLQLFDLNAEALEAAAPLDLIAIADGQPLSLDNTALTAFPGIDARRSINIYVYNPTLGAPVALPLLTEANAIGLCAAAAEGYEAVFQLAYWTPDAPNKLIQGHILRGADNFEWSEHARSTIDGPIQTCLIGENGTPQARQDGTAIATISSSSDIKTLSLSDSGMMRLVNGESTPVPITIREGITVRVPDSISAMAALSDVRFGGYPNGVIAIGGDTDDQDFRIVLVEPRPLFDPEP